MVKQATRDNLIVIGVLVGVVGAAAVFVYLPQRRRLHELRTKITGEKLRLAESSGSAATVPGMMRKVQEMKKRYSNFDQRLPRQQELGGFLREISGNLSQEQLANQVIEPGNPVGAKLYHTLPITLRFHGPYLSMASFLKRLAAMERLTQIQRLTLRGEPGTAPEGAAVPLDIEVLMNIYFTKS